MAHDQSGKRRSPSAPTSVRTERLLEILYQSSKPLSTAALARQAKLETSQVHPALEAPLARGEVARRRQQASAATTALHGETRRVQRPEVIWSLTTKGRTGVALRLSAASTPK